MTAPLPLLLAWSGGKDSAWALHVLRQRDDVDVVALLTTLTEGFDRSSMQGIRREVLQTQADAAGLPLLQSWIPQGCDNTRYEQAFARSLEDAASRWPGLRCMAFGDLLLADIRQWREDLCARLGWRAHFPLFGSDTAVLAREIIDMDDVIDDLFDTIKGELIDLIARNPENGEQAIDLLMIAKYFERIGDHAQNIAEWAEFSITGVHKGAEL